MKFFTLIAAFSTVAMASAAELSNLAQGENSPVGFKNSNIPNMTPAVSSIDTATFHAFLFSHEQTPEYKSLSDEDKRQLSLLAYMNRSQLNPRDVEELTHQQLTESGHLSMKTVAKIEGAMFKVENNMPLQREDFAAIQEAIQSFEKAPFASLAPMFSRLPDFIRTHADAFPKGSLEILRLANLKAVGLSQSEIASLDKLSDQKAPTKEQAAALEKVSLLDHLPPGMSAFDPVKARIYQSSIRELPRMEQAPSTKELQPRSEKKASPVLKEQNPHIQRAPRQ